MTYCLWWYAEEKLHFTQVHTLRQLKRDEALFPPFRRVIEFPARYRQIPGRGFLGVGKIWRLFNLRSASYKRLYTHGHTHTHGYTHTRRLIYDKQDPRYSAEGLLRAFGKCTNCVAFSKGRPNLACVRLTLWQKKYFTSVLMSIPRYSADV